MNPRDTLIALSHVVLCSFRTGTLVTRNSHASLLCRRRFALLHSRCYTRSEFVLHLSPRPTSFSVYPGHSHCYNDSVHLWLVYFGSHTSTLALIAFYTLIIHPLQGNWSTDSICLSSFRHLSHFVVPSSLYKSIVTHHLYTISLHFTVTFLPSFYVTSKLFPAAEYPSLNIYSCLYVYTIPLLHPSTHTHLFPHI